MKILVPIDETDLSRSAIPVAARMVRDDGGELLLATVGEVAETSRHESEESAALQRMLEDAASRVDGVNVRTRFELAGDPADGIMQIAREERADRIVIASSAEGKFEALVDGSVAEDLEEESRLPVTVVSPGDGS